MIIVYPVYSYKFHHTCCHWFVYHQWTHTFLLPVLFTTSQSKLLSSMLLSLHYSGPRNLDCYNSDCYIRVSEVTKKCSSQWHWTMGSGPATTCLSQSATCYHQKLMIAASYFVIAIGACYFSMPTRPYIMQLKFWLSVVNKDDGSGMVIF